MLLYRCDLAFIMDLSVVIYRKVKVRKRYGFCLFLAT